MFAYCNNNPVVYADSAGFAPWPTTCVINDGGYDPSYVETDSDPMSQNLAEKYATLPLPNADGTVCARIRRDGHYTYDPDAPGKYMVAFVEVMIVLSPTMFDDVLLLSNIAKASKYLGIASSTATVLCIPSRTQTYDRYSITQTWVTKEPVYGRDDYYEKISHCHIDYYYYIGDGNGGYVWCRCGSSYTFTKEIFPTT